ncbi:hypothetical protein LPJ72_005095 [Coemansia sp. Benny D160-2]|nr:hypothetical protein LPJ72_005095 [Coemansia sp. Benny D160-2]
MSTGKDSVFKAFAAFDFDNDAAFQTGLQTIPNNSDPRVLEQAKIFYFSKTVAPLNASEYAEWKAAHSASDNNNVGTEPTENVGENVGGDAGDQGSQSHLPSAAGIPGAPYSASFVEIVDMIVQGKEIPGIRDIPDLINDQTPSASTAKAPPKPWETQQEPQ